MTIKTVTYPTGASFTDTRPGHTVPGLLYTEDPFQRAEYVRIGTVGPRVRRHVEDGSDMTWIR